jgi:hypothetical protein
MRAISGREYREIISFRNAARYAPRPPSSIARRRMNRRRREGKALRYARRTLD